MTIIISENLNATLGLRNKSENKMIDHSYEIKKIMFNCSFGMEWTILISPKFMNFIS